MSGDLVSFRMLFVAPRQPGRDIWHPDHDLWRQGAAMASVPVEFFAHDATTATAELAKGGVDICVMDSALAPEEKADVIKAADQSQPPPFTIESASRGSPRTEGSDGVLPRPSSADDARKLVDVCVRAKIPTRVLVVDNSGTMRTIIRKILSASRFTLEISEASDGEAALDQLRGGRVGVVFLDYNMPGANGFETLTKLKHESPGVAVVMMTSTLDNVIADRAHASGALAFLKKPFYPADIDAVLGRFYGLHAPLG